MITPAPQTHPVEMTRHLFQTSGGVVELAYASLDGPLALVLPGGHCDAMANVGWSAIEAAGLGVVSVSRPGYGATDVGPLSPTEFVGPLSEALRLARIDAIEATVGVSFGGPTAVAYAVNGTPRARRLVLLNAAPSAHAYPDTAREARVGPLAFAPGIQRLTWAMVRAMVATGAGLRMMLGSLSALPLGRWWSTWSDADRQQARAMFRAMDSGRGFVTDLRYGGAEHARERLATQRRVAIPTLVLSSAHDGAVSERHARDFAETIPGARRVVTSGESHLAWLGPHGHEVTAALRDFRADGS